MEFPLTFPFFRYNPQNVMIIPHCKFEGIISAAAKDVTNTNQGTTFEGGVSENYPLTIRHSAGGGPVARTDDLDGGFRSGALVYRGATYSKKTMKSDDMISPNNGHFGSLDCPAGFSKLHGQNVMEAMHRTH